VAEIPGRQQGAARMIRVLVIGELNVDLILSGCGRLPTLGTEITAADFAMTLGSASAIFAVGMARLDRPVSFAGKVGADPWGAYCLDVLQSAGVDVGAVVRDPASKTGVTVSLTFAHDRALVTYPGAMATFTASELPKAVFAGTGHLHVSSFFLQTGMRRAWRDVFERARTLGWTISLDPGCDPENAWDDDLIELLPMVDLLLPNEVELEGLARTADPAEALRRLQNGHTTTVAKLGARGCMALLDGTPVLVAPPPVAPVDTTGAGDSFNAGFVHAWLDRRPLRDCMRAGVVCGALSTRALGGTTAQATAQELARYLEAGW
jgi:sugar/nucleoside kinase (ribokinase family)